MTEMEQNLKLETTNALQNSDDNLQSSSELDAQLLESQLTDARETLADLRAQRGAFTADLQKAAHGEEVATDRVRLRLDDATTITEPRERNANLREILVAIESEIEAAEKSVFADEIRLEFAQSLERLASFANDADQTARDFHARRLEIAHQLETGLNELGEIENRVAKAQAAFTSEAARFERRFPPEIPQYHMALSQGRNHASLVVSGENILAILAGRGVPLQNVKKTLRGQNDLASLLFSFPITAGYGESHRLDGAVNRALREFLNPGTPL